MQRPLLAATLLLVACHAAPPAREAASFTWPVPAGWKHETIPFPLDFAPELPFRGVEELRFAPGFFQPASATYWSYDFAWWLEDVPALDARVLSDALGTYFRGLAQAVGGTKYAFDPARFRAELQREHDEQGEFLAGDVASYDPFVTGAPIVLHVEVRARHAPGSTRGALLFLVTPRPAGDPVWAELRACAAGWSST